MVATLKANAAQQAEVAERWQNEHEIAEAMKIVAEQRAEKMRARREKSEKLLSKVKKKAAPKPEPEITPSAQDLLGNSYNSLNHYLRMHRGCEDEDLAPNRGSILHGLWRKKQLSRQQLKAWKWFYGDLKCAMGSTNAMVGSPEGGASSANYASRQIERSYPGPTTYWTSQASKVEQIWGSLRNHEKGLLEQLVRDTRRTEGMKEVHSHDLRYLGNLLSGYEDDRQKIAAGVSAIQRLLISLAESYGIPHYTS